MWWCCRDLQQRHNRYIDTTMQLRRSMNRPSQWSSRKHFSVMVNCMRNNGSCPFTCVDNINKLLVDKVAYIIWAIRQIHVHLETSCRDWVLARVLGALHIPTYNMYKCNKSKTFKRVQLILVNLLKTHSLYHLKLTGSCACMTMHSDIIFIYLFFFAHT